MSGQGDIDTAQRTVDLAQRRVDAAQRYEDDERRHYDDKLEKIFILLNGDGLNDPGMKGMIRDTFHTLHGTSDTKGLVERVTNLERRDDTRDQRQVKFLWYVGSVGAGLGIVGGWVLSHFGEVTLFGRPIVKSVAP